MLKDFEWQGKKVKNYFLISNFFNKGEPNTDSYDYLKNNSIKPGSYRSGYLPLLMAFNKNSQSPPCRMVQCPNRQAVCKPSKNHMVQDGKNRISKNHMVQDRENRPLGETVMEGDETTIESKPKLLSYNDYIKSYDLTLLTQDYS